MRMTVLGGAAAGPNTGMGCSGYLIECEDTRILVDPGPGTVQELRKHADFRSLTAVVVSHVHLDHMLDLLVLRHALTYNAIRRLTPTPVWLPPGGAEFLARACAPFDECDDPGRFEATVDVAEYDPDRGLDIGNFFIDFQRTVHYLPTWAMRFRAVDRTDLGFTADGGPTSKLAPSFQDVDILLAEATLLAAGDRPIETRGSLTAEEAGRLATDCDAETLVITHYWEEHGPETILAAAAGAFSGRIELARPGLVVETS